MSESPTDILIFGAGFGTRMAPLTDSTPKPLIPVGGKPLIDHAIALAEDEQLNVHVNTHYLAEKMRDHLSGHAVIHEEQPDILDTGGGLKAALPRIAGDPIATLNSDAIWSGPNPLSMLKRAWRVEMDALLLLVPLENTTGYSRAGNFLQDLDGKLTRSDAGQVYTGAQLIRRQSVLTQDGTVFSLNAVWDGLLGKGTLYGLTYPGNWADVGTPAGIGEAEKMIGYSDV